MCTTLQLVSIIEYVSTVDPVPYITCNNVCEALNYQTNISILDNTTGNKIRSVYESFAVFPIHGSGQ